MTTPVFIPARMGSTRFPGKPLAMILGKSMIQRVCELSELAVGRKNVFVATDSDLIREHVSTIGFQTVMTSEECRTGTDRVADAMRIVGADRGINVQGDEPMVSPLLILRAAEEMEKKETVVNFCTPLSIHEDVASPTIPKVVLDQMGRLLYASRAVIPATKDPSDAGSPMFKKQVCVYGYKLSHLSGFGHGAVKTHLESFEDIEILRFLELGIPVHFLETEFTSLAVDIPDDISRVERAIKELNKEA